MTDVEQFLTVPLAGMGQGASLCSRCAERGTSCCRTDPKLTHLSFPLSVAEWHRLVPFASLSTLTAPTDKERFAREDAEAKQTAQAIGLHDLPPEPLPGSPPENGDTICSMEHNDTEFIASMHALFPGENERITTLFPRNARHRSLRTRSDGSCVFLGLEGCRLPRAIRPIYCLLFPAWVIHGSLTLFLSQECLISKKARGPADAVGLMGEEPAHIRALHSALRRDWGLDPSF